MNLDNLRDLDEILASEEFNNAMEKADFSPLDSLWNSTLSENILADTGRYPE